MTNNINDQKYGLHKNDLDKILKTILNNNFVDKIILFGSRSLNTFREGSDIDLAIVGENISYNDLRKIKIELDELKLVYQFDLLIYNDNLAIDVKNHIDKLGIILYPFSIN